MISVCGPGSARAVRGSAERPAPRREAWLHAQSDETNRAAVTGMLRAYDSDPGFDPSTAAGDTSTGRRRGWAGGRAANG